jgi:hypothetical protein
MIASEAHKRGQTAGGALEAFKGGGDQNQITACIVLAVINRQLSPSLVGSVTRSYRFINIGPAVWRRQPRGRPLSRLLEKA